MAIKTKRSSETKRRGLHHRHGKDYKQVYWPYLPLLGISFVILVASFLPPRFNSGQTLAYSSNLSPTSLLEATNERRTANERGKVRINEQLNQAAQAKANDMAYRNYWSHQTPEGQEPWIFINGAGYKYARAGENLAYGFRDSNGTVQGWMHSQTHRDNMLDGEFTEAGFGYANSANFQDNGPVTVVVAMYARPQALGSTTGANPSTNTASILAASQPVTRAETLLGLPPAVTGVLIGLTAGGAVVGLFINHGLRLRRLVRRGEKYFVAHPLLDLSLVLLIIATFNFSKVVGYIH